MRLHAFAVLTLGLVCGYGGLLVLRRGDDGAWAVVRQLTFMES